MNDLKIGDVTVTRIEEMHGPIMPPDQFFPEMPEEAWRENRETLVPDHLDADGGMVRGAFQTWLLRSGGRTILIDTGIGNDKTRPANNPDIAGSVNENSFDDSLAPVHAEGQVQLWEGSHTIDANLRLETAPGHTPGSSVVKLASGGHRALFAGDILHTPLQVLYPDCNSCFCQDPAEARTTRRRLLGWAADHHALVLPAHVSGHSAFEIAERGDSFAIKGWAAIEPY